MSDSNPPSDAGPADLGMLDGRVRMGARRVENRIEDPVEDPVESPVMRRLHHALVRVARFPTAVLLTGETGTGKGTIARALHRVSPRAGDPFVHVDCAGLVDGLLESELYGVAQGAFTGAARARAGRFEAADKGTLFLDEIGELSAAGQIKLLRVLEEGTFERVGENRTRRLRARVIAATHVDLEAAVARGAFRSDLYFRLRVLHLEVPPLRHQQEDLETWLEKALSRASERLDCPPARFSSEALDRLRNHDWPGNLREFFHVIEAATILAEGARVEATLLDELLCPVQRTPPPGRTESRGRQASRAVDMSRVGFELERAKGNLSLVARRLGVPRSTLRYRLGLDDAISRGRRRRADRSRRDESPPE